MSLLEKIKNQDEEKKGKNIDKEGQSDRKMQNFESVSDMYLNTYF